MPQSEPDEHVDEASGYAEGEGEPDCAAKPLNVRVLLVHAHTNLTMSPSSFPSTVPMLVTSGARTASTLAISRADSRIGVAPLPSVMIGVSALVSLPRSRNLRSAGEADSSCVTAGGATDSSRPVSAGSPPARLCERVHLRGMARHLP